MQFTAFNLDSALERGEIGEELGFDSGLQLANSPDERLQIMKATEYVLGIFQERQSSPDRRHLALREPLQASNEVS